MNWLKVARVAVVVATIVAVLTEAFRAKADNMGLFWSDSTVADGVRVRTLRDTDRGVVCYVASTWRGVYGGASVSASISCVKVPQ